MFDFVSFIPRAVAQGIPLLYGSTGETLTETQLIRNSGCVSCPIRCERRVPVDGGWQYFCE